MPPWLPFAALALLLLVLPIITLLLARGGTSAGALRAATVIAASEGIVIFGAAFWLSQPGEPLFWVLFFLGISELVAVWRMWHAFSRSRR